MKSINFWAPLLLLCALSPFVHPQAYSQTPSPQPASAQNQSGAAATTRRAGLVLAENTPVKLKLTRTVSSKDAKVAEKVVFEVVDDVKIGEVVVIQHSASAVATVTEAKAKSLTHSGKLDMNIEYVPMVSGEKVPLRATKVVKGESQNAAVKGAMIATSLLLFPTPMLLSKDIAIKEGTEVTAYVAADTPLETAKSTASSMSAVAIQSTPDGADITVDEKFVGTTPSTVQLNAGEHKIVVSKTHFKSWERTMAVTANSNVNLNVELEKLP